MDWARWARWAEPGGLGQVDWARWARWAEPGGLGQVDWARWAGPGMWAGPGGLVHVQVFVGRCLATKISKAHISKLKWWRRSPGG